LLLCCGPTALWANPCVDQECDHTTSIDVKENDTGLYFITVNIPKTYVSHCSYHHIIMGFQVITSNNPYSSFPARCIGKN